MKKETAHDVKEGTAPPFCQKPFIVTNEFTAAISTPQTRQKALLDDDDDDDDDDVCLCYSFFCGAPSSSSRDGRELFPYDQVSKGVRRIW